VTAIAGLAQRLTTRRVRVAHRDQLGKFQKQEPAVQANCTDDGFPVAAVGHGGVAGREVMFEMTGPSFDHLVLSCSNAAEAVARAADIKPAHVPR
jgi:hypothetical protein